MVQHAIPRQITTFEFKLIGFLTLKQFLYLVVFIPTAFIVYKLIPFPLINILFAVLAGFMGFALAFIPVNDRPFDVWLKNLATSLFSPTQFTYQKESRSLYFLENLVFIKNPHIIAAHIESKDKLNAYLQKTKTNVSIKPNKHMINTLISSPTINIKPKVISSNATPLPNIVKTTQTPPKKPFLMGAIRNNKNMGLPSILVYIKDQKNQTLRILKTNAHGVFATFSPIPSGDYIFEMKDPKTKHFFATIKKRVENQNPILFEFFSKELI